jgi:hypothetical protein
VSLQGTIETFAIADVLRLLAATSKSGRLQVQGPARSGTVWVDSGNILGAESPNTPYAHAAADVLFQLLRFDRGSFRFELDRSPPQPTEPVAIEAALHDAEAMVAEWRDLEQSIPSIDGWVTLRESLPDGSVTISSENWRGIRSIGFGRTVAALGDALNLGELPVYRAVNQLLQLGVVDVGSPPADSESRGSADVSSPDTAGSALLDEMAGSRTADFPAAPAFSETSSDDRARAMSGSGPIASSVSSEIETGAEEGEARRRLDALASSLGVSTSADNGSIESGAAPPPVAAAEAGSFTSFAPPPPATPSAAAAPEGVRADAGLTTTPDSNGATESTTYGSPSSTGTADNGAVSYEHGTEFVGSAAETSYTEAAPAESPTAEGTASPAYGEYGQQQPPAYGEYGQQQPPAYGEYGQQQPPAYGEYGQQQPPAYGEYGQQQPPAYGEYGQYGQQQPPAYGEYGGQNSGYPAPPPYSYEGYADPNQAYAQPAPYAPEGEAWVPPAPPLPQPGSEAQPTGEVHQGADPTQAWPVSEEATRGRTIFESTAPPPPPPPPAPSGSPEGWPTGSAWFDGPTPERIAPPPPPPPPPVGVVADAGRGDSAAATNPGSQGQPATPDDPANIERQLLNLSDRAREAVKRSSGLFEGRSRR